MTIEFKARLKAGMFYDKNAGVYVTYAPALGIYSQGETKREAKAALKDAVESFLLVSHKKGILSELLRSADFCDGEEYVSVDENILKERKFMDIFSIPACLSLELAQAQ